MGKIKQVLGDFKVKEILHLDKSEGKYHYYILKKKGYSTLGAIEKISKNLRIPLKQIGYAGNKDSFAETEQYVSFIGISKKRIDGFSFKNIYLKYAGSGSKRINLGDNKGNSFEIRVYAYKKYYPSNFFVNYYGEQRLGKENLYVGRKILRGENIGLDLRRKRFCVHAVQSLLWNKVVTILLEKSLSESIFSVGDYVFLDKKIKNFKIPLINFDTELNGEIGEIYSKILADEGIKQKDFIFKGDSRLISETVFRDLIVNVDKVIFKNDVLRFKLPTGSYATVFVRKLFRENV